MNHHFGRCPWFIIYDTETGSYEALENSAREASSAAGPQAAELVSEKGVKITIAGDFGPKVKFVLDSLSIKMIREKDENKTVREIAEAFRKEQMFKNQ